MKTTLCLALLAALTLIESGCYTPPPPAAVSVQAPVPPPPAVVTVQPPVPPPTGYVTYTPDYYVWDGNEYVGVSNGQYVYWSGAAWIVAPPIVIGRFNGWARFHPDWRRSAIPYHGGRFHDRWER